MCCPLVVGRGSVTPLADGGIAEPCGRTAVGASSSTPRAKKTCLQNGQRTWRWAKTSATRESFWQCSQRVRMGIMLLQLELHLNGADLNDIAVFERAKLTRIDAGTVDEGAVLTSQVFDAQSFVIGNNSSMLA